VVLEKSIVSRVFLQPPILPPGPSLKKDRNTVRRIENEPRREVVGSGFLGGKMFVFSFQIRRRAVFPALFYSGDIKYSYVKFARMRSASLTEVAVWMR
jgi:hypothetical protein